jgi:NADH dehydrogenase (ubiquinone) Fe-S protein 1
MRAQDGSFKELTWEEALRTAGEKLTSVRGDDIHGMIG